MSFSFPSVRRLAGLAGLGFVLLLLLANGVLIAAGFPPPASGADFEKIGSVFADEQGALRLASSFLPAAWLLATVFAAGVFELVRRTEPGWAVVGLAGVLMQSVAFVGVEASRLALGMAAVHDPGAVPGWLGLYDALFGFNQVFLATALLGLTVGGLRAKVVARWHAGVGLLGAVLLFASSTASPYGAEGGNPLALAGLAGWLLWLVWIVAFSVKLLGSRKE